jgi:hypothetical protein
MGSSEVTDVETEKESKRSGSTENEEHRANKSNPQILKPNLI